MFKKKVALLLAGAMTISTLSVNSVENVYASEDEGMKAVESTEGASAEEGTNTANNNIEINGSGIDSEQDNSQEETENIANGEDLSEQDNSQENSESTSDGEDLSEQNTSAVLEAETGVEVGPESEAVDNSNVNNNEENFVEDNFSSDNNEEYLESENQESENPEASTDVSDNSVPNDENEKADQPDTEETEVADAQENESAEELQNVNADTEQKNVADEDGNNLVASEEKSPVEEETKADDFDQEREVDEEIETAIEQGVFAYNEKDESSKIILVSNNHEDVEEALADSDATGHSLDDEISTGSGAEGEEEDEGEDTNSDSDSGNKVITELIINVPTDTTQTNNSQAGNYETVDGVNPQGTIKVILSGLTDGNKNSTIAAISQYYLQLSNYCLKLVNDNYVDAEKYSTNDEDEGYDTQKCWAAATSEMLWLSGWANYIIPDAQSVDDVMDYYTRHFTDSAGEPDAALNYIFYGEDKYEYKGVSNTAQVVSGYEDGNKSNNTNNIALSTIASGFVSVCNNLSGIGLIENVAQQAVGTFLKWLSPDGTLSSSAHWLTTVGVIIDPTKETTDTDRYKAIILADSDNDGTRLEGDPSIKDPGFSLDAALTAKKGKINSYTVYGLSTAETNGNTYWTINNYLGNSTTKAVISGFEYMIKYVPTPSSSTSSEETAGTDSGSEIPEEHKDNDPIDNGYYGPEMWEETEYWNADDYWDEWGDYPDEENKPEENKTEEKKPEENKSEENKSEESNHEENNHEEKIPDKNNHSNSSQKNESNDAPSQNDTEQKNESNNAPNQNNSEQKNENSNNSSSTNENNNGVDSKEEQQFISGINLGSIIANIFGGSSEGSETKVNSASESLTAENVENTSTPMTQADIDAALQQAKIENAVDSLSQSSTAEYYTEKASYNSATDSNYNVYVKGTPELVTEVTVDGIKLPAGSYRILAKRGNVIQVVVSKAILDKLPKGQHYLAVSYKNVVNPVLVEFIVE